MQREQSAHQPISIPKTGPCEGSKYGANMETRLIIAYLLIALMMAIAACLTVGIIRKRRKARIMRQGHSSYRNINVR